MTVTAPPDALSDAARRFLAGPQNMLIGEERVPAADGRTFGTLDPSSGEVIAQVAHAGPQDVDAAVRAAGAAFEQGSKWRRAPASERTRLLMRLAEDVQELGTIEQAPQQDGRNMTMLLAPLKRRPEEAQQASA